MANPFVHIELQTKDVETSKEMGWFSVLAPIRPARPSVSGSLNPVCKVEIR